MPFNKITDDFSASPQISIEEMGDVAAAGFKTIICNRPDGEEPGQPSFAEVEAAAEAQGIKMVAIPIRQPDQAAVAAMAEALSNADGPVLGYCRTGTRSTMLWTLTQIGKRPADEIARMTASAGYDMNPLLAQMKA